MFPVAMTFEMILMCRLRRHEIAGVSRRAIRGLGAVGAASYLNLSFSPVVVSQTLPPSQVSDSFNIAPVRRADNAQRVEK